jgi:hypothetical protein
VLQGEGIYYKDMFRYSSVFKAGMSFMILILFAAAAAYLLVREEIPALSPERIEMKDWDKQEIASALGEPLSKQEGCWIYKEGKICFKK